MNSHFSPGALILATKLEWRAAQLRTMYEQLPDFKNVTESILLDAWTSASIEGANVSLTQVKQHLKNPQTKDDKMVVNAVRGSNYAYVRPITRKNLRTLWERVTEGVCENTHLDGKPAWWRSAALPGLSIRPPRRSGFPT